MTTNRKIRKATSSKTRSQSAARKKPGQSGQGDYYHIEVLPKGDFVTFRTQDVGRRGHIQRVAGM